MDTADTTERQIQDELITIVDDLERSAEVAIGEVARQARLHLSASRAGEPGIADTAVVAVEGPDVEAPVRAQRPVDIEIGARKRPSPPICHHVPLHVGTTRLVDQI